MNLNFELRHPEGGVELVFDGMNWDLHNFASYAGCAHDPEAQTLSMKWLAPLDCSNPWGDAGNSAASCELLFEGVTEIREVPGKERLSEGADTLMQVYKAIPGECEYPLKMKWEDGEPFDLVFVFEDEAEVRVVASRCRLIGGRGV